MANFLEWEEKQLKLKCFKIIKLSWTENFIRFTNLNLSSGVVTEGILYKADPDADPDLQKKQTPDL